MKRTTFFILFFIWVLSSNAQSTTNLGFDEILGPCGFAGCYDNYYVGKVKNGKEYRYYLIDSTKKVLTVNYYDEFDLCADYCGVWFVNGFLKVKRNNKWGFLNENGIEAIKCDFDSVKYFKDGYAFVCKNKKWGLINEYSKVVIEYKFSFVDGPFDDYYVVGFRNGKKGIVKTNGLLISEIKFDEIDRKWRGVNADFFTNDLHLVKIKSKYGYLNKVGELQISCRYEDATVFSMSKACVKEKGKWGVINDNGEYLIPNKYDSIVKINENIDTNLRWFAVVIFQNKPILIDEKGKKIIDFPFLTIEPFSSGMAAVLDNSNRWGFMDTTFSLKIPCRYNDIPNYCIMSWSYPPRFVGSNCLVSKGKVERGPYGIFGIINNKGEDVIPWSSCFFELPPDDNYYSVICGQNGKLGLIDHKLNLVVQCIYDEFYQLWHYQPFELYSECSFAHYYIKEGELIPAKLKNQYGYIDRNGVVKIPFIYEQASHFENGKAKVTLNGVEITIDKNGNKIQ